MLFYHDKNIELHWGRCQDILPDLPQVSAIITDPPYGVGFADWDEPVSQGDLDMCRVKAPVVIFFGAAPPRCFQHIFSLSPLCDRIAIWHNPLMRPSNGACWQYQPIYIWGKVPDLQSDVLICHSSEGSGAALHPAQKPENLMR